MNLHKSLALTAVLALLVPLLGAFGLSPKVEAADPAPVGQVLVSTELYANANYFNPVTEYTFSLNGVVQQSSSPPPEADWITPSEYYSGGWFRASWNEEYTYSRFGAIQQTDNPMNIPADAAWATLSSFQVETTGNQHKIIDPLFYYSLNGIDKLIASKVSDIPPNALWATIYEFSEGWFQRTNNPVFADYSLKRTSPAVNKLEISSDNAYPGYASNGDLVTLTLQTDVPIMQPVLKISGEAAQVSGSGTDWTGTLELDGTIGDGELPVSVSAFAIDGAPLYAKNTTDGSSIVKDGTPPSLAPSLYPDDATREDVFVEVEATDGGSGLAETKWAAGTRTAAYFATQGEAFAVEFSAEENGTYTVYGRDRAGNEKVVTVDVANIDREAPSLTLTPSTTEPTGEAVTVTVDAEDPASGIRSLRWSARAPEPDSPWKSADVENGRFAAETNGTYTIIARDNAGNETMKQIAISNTRSIDANLDRFAVTDGRQALELVPAFDPDRTDYRMNVANGVSSIRISAQASEQGSTLSVNGRPVAPGDVVDVNLSVGANTVTVSVTAPLPSVKKIYTILVTRAAAAPSGAAASPSVSFSSAPAVPSAKMPGAFRAELSGQALTGKALDEVAAAAKTAANGSIEYEIRLDDASEILAQAPKNKPNELWLKRDTASRVDTLTLRISEQAQAQLRAGQVGLNLDLGGVRYALPAGFSADGGGDLLTKVTLLPSEENEAMRQAVSSRLDPGAQPRLLGNIADFSTNARTTAGADAEVFFLPISSGFDQTQTKKLVAFVQDADGRGSVLPGILRRDAQGRATGLTVNLGGSGRVVLLQAEPKITEQAGYVQGVSGQSFAPNRAVTRAELAALLNQLSEPSAAAPAATGASFRDLPQTSWAASAVARVTEAGWMSGGADDFFRPNDALTRGELAVVLARWKQIQAGGRSASFTDSIPAWAAEAVDSAEREGWIKGYTDGSFRAGQSVTRAEAITILNRATGRRSLEDDRIALWTDVPNAYWAAGAIRSASRTIEVRTYANGEVETAAK